MDYARKRNPCKFRIFTQDEALYSHGIEEQAQLRIDISSARAHIHLVSLRDTFVFRSRYLYVAYV